MSLETPPNPNSKYEHIPSPVSAGQRQRRRAKNLRNRVPRRFRKYFRWRIILIVVFSVLVLGSVGVSVLLTDATNELNSSWASVNRVIGSVSKRGTTQLTVSELNRLGDSLRELDRQLGLTRSRVGLIAPLTRANPDWLASVQMLEVSQELTAAAVDLLEGTQPALDFLVGGDDEATVGATRLPAGERIVDLLQVGEGRFLEAQNRLRRAAAVLDEVDYSQISPDLLLQLDQMSNYQQQLDTMTTGLLRAPDLLNTMLGLEEARSYLILAQNNDEIRPSGGFISTYGVITIRNGRITDYFYSPSSPTTPNPPTADFMDSYNPPAWWLRFENPVYVAWDASWTPNFPTTADMALNYYNAGNNRNAPLDGVLALDVDAFQALLAALGSVDVPSYNRTVTAGNFRDAVYDLRAYSDAEHKQFLAALYRAIFSEWQSLADAENEAMLTALLRSVEQKHLMLYFVDDAANEAVQLLGWSGLQLPADTIDYVQVVDTNMGNKSNNSVQRTLTYDVVIQPDGSLENRLQLRYDYDAGTAANDPAVDPRFHGPIDYYNLLQVFLPVGAVPTSSDLPRQQVVDMDSHTVLVSRVDVSYGEGARFDISYTTPPRLEQVGSYQRYRLVVQKQPGARTQTLDVTVSLPAGARLISASPQPTETYNLGQPILAYALQLDTDIQLDIVFD